MGLESTEKPHLELVLSPEGHSGRTTATQFNATSNPPPYLEKVIRLLVQSEPRTGYTSRREIHSIMRRASRRDYSTPGFCDDAARFLKQYGVLHESEKRLMDAAAGDRLCAMMAEGRKPPLPQEDELQSRYLELEEAKKPQVRAGAKSGLAAHDTVAIESVGDLEEDQLTVMDVEDREGLDDATTLELDPSFPFLLGLELMPLVPILADQDMADGLSDEELTGYHSALLLQAQNSTAMAQKAEGFLRARAEAAEQRRAAAERAAEKAAMDAALEANAALERLRAQAEEAKALANEALAKARAAREQVARQEAEAMRRWAAAMGSTS